MTKPGTESFVTPTARACFDTASRVASAWVIGIRGALLARALFSAEHGIVNLGLDQKLGSISNDDLHWQVRVVLEAAQRGLPIADELS